MRLFWKIALIVLLQSTVCLTLRASDAEAERAVYEMFEAQGMREQMNRIVLVMVQNQINAAPQLKAYEVPLTQLFMQIASYDALKKDLARIYLKYFTVDEIREITKFYRSPVGQKMKNVSAPILLEANELSRKRIEAAVPKFLEAVRNRGMMQ